MMILLCMKLTKLFSEDEDDEEADSSVLKTKEDERARKRAKIPDWATTPHLRKTLENQVEINPENIFGGHVEIVDLNGKLLCMQRVNFYKYIYFFSGVQKEAAKTAINSVKVIFVPFFHFFEHFLAMSDKLTRIALVSSDKCKPKKCRQECKKSCPVVRMGKVYYIFVSTCLFFPLPYLLLLVLISPFRQALYRGWRDFQDCIYF